VQLLVEQKGEQMTSSLLDIAPPPSFGSVAYVLVAKVRDDLITHIPSTFQETRIHTGINIKGDNRCWKADRKRVCEFIEGLDPFLQTSFQVFVQDPRWGWVAVRGTKQRRQFLLGTEKVGSDIELDVESDTESPAQ
jgi:hypothetical protein